MTKFLWLDMEMTGLDIEKEVPIEVAVVVTDEKWAVHDQYHAVIKQPDAYLQNMDEWNRRTHNESGLVALIPSGKDIKTVETDLLALVEKHYSPKEKPILCGNSIFQDRIFVNKFFKQFNERLHYRMLDVTAFKVVYNNCYRISYTKPESRHRAIDDVMESIKELQRYLSFVKVPGM